MGIFGKYRWLILAIILFSVLDIATTYYIVCEKGGIEINQYYTQLVYKFGFIPSAFIKTAYSFSTFLICAFILDKFATKHMPKWLIFSILFLSFVSILIVVNIFNISNIVSKPIKLLYPLITDKLTANEYVNNFSHQKFCRTW